MKLVFVTETGVRFLGSEVMNSRFDELSNTSPDFCSAERADHARKMAKDGLIMTVAQNGLWNAHSEDRKVHVNSYEKFGYHAKGRGFFEEFVRAGGRVEFLGFCGVRGSLVRFEE